MVQDRNLGIGKRIINSKLLLVLSVLILIFFTVNLTKTIVSRQDLLHEIGALEQGINNLKSRNKELAVLIEYFKTMDFVEAEARTKLNLRKPGEKIIVVPSEEKIKNQENRADENSIIINSQTLEQNNFIRWLDYFFKID
jgi:cell division protein FtsB